VGKETSLRELLALAVPSDNAEIVLGTVTSTSPLEIQVANDPKLKVTDSNVFVPKHLTNYSVSIHLSGSIDGHSIGTRSGTIYNALKRGDQVYMLAYNHGGLYFVLDKAG